MVGRAVREHAGIGDEHRDERNGGKGGGIAPRERPRARFTHER
jgi:hypothetical protein